MPASPPKCRFSEIPPDRLVCDIGKPIFAFLSRVDEAFKMLPDDAAISLFPENLNIELTLSTNQLPAQQINCLLWNKSKQTQIWIHTDITYYIISNISMIKKQTSMGIKTKMACINTIHHKI